MFLSKNQWKKFVHGMSSNDKKTNSIIALYLNALGALFKYCAQDEQVSYNKHFT